MRNTLIYLTVVMLLACCGGTAASIDKANDAARGRHTQRLCDALQTVEAGQRLNVVISGVYAVGPEHQIFYDPDELTCRFDVQPVTWVEFAATAGQSDAFAREINAADDSARVRRAYVTFTGELHGPGLVAPDDPSLPTMVAFANRTKSRRYGHSSGFRTKLVVTKIEHVKSVDESVVWPSVVTQPDSLTVEHAEVPQYPAMARNVGIAGDVVMKVIVTRGAVTEVHVISGDRMLSDESVRNVKTWQFSPETTIAFSTTVSYELENRRAGETTTPRVELQLPERVRVVGARNNW
jgi:TonB family protein